MSNSFDTDITQLLKKPEHQYTLGQNPPAHHEQHSDSDGGYIARAPVNEGYSANTRVQNPNVVDHTHAGPTYDPTLSTPGQTITERNDDGTHRTSTIHPPLGPPPGFGSHVVGGTAVPNHNRTHHEQSLVDAGRTRPEPTKTSKHQPDVSSFPGIPAIPVPDQGHTSSIPRVSTGQKLAGKVEYAFGSAIGNESLKEKGLEKQYPGHLLQDPTVPPGMGR